jgi:small subunit ribosomal protein S9
VSDDSERDEAAEPQPDIEQPEAEQTEAAATQPDAEAEQPEAAEPQPDAEAEQPEPEAEQPEPEAQQPPVAAERPPAEADQPAEAEQPQAAPVAERPRRQRSKDSEGKEVVPGADLEPIAISEEERELTAEERAAREAEEEERRAREAAATDHEDDAAIAPRSVSVPTDTRIQATGKRKSAVARVIVRAGDGSFEINDRGIDEYFKSSQHEALARQPLVTSGYESSVDVTVRVHGGGISGQAGAVRHGVARALTALEPELRGDLKRRGMLTRDDRRKERKKAGLKKARKRPQFSKR